MNMNISLQIEAVYRRALLLRKRAIELPVQHDLVEEAIKELYFVLEELHTSQEELQHQNRELLATRQEIELERQRYRTLFELAPEGYLVTDRQGNIRQANRAAARLLSVSPGFLVNKPLVVFIDPSDRDRFHSQLGYLEQVQDWELTLQPRRGEPIPVMISVASMSDRRGEKVEFLWSIRDIRLRKQMEQQLQAAYDDLEQRVADRTAELAQANAHLHQEILDRQQAERRIREQAALIDIATDAIFVQDLDQHIRFWSKGAERLYGWTAEEVLGARADECCDAAAQDWVAATAEVIESGVWQGERAQVTKTGQALTVASRWTLVRDEAGTPQSILVVNTDITEKKQLEQQFYRAQRYESLGTLAGGIAHDLNNVFTPILAIAQLLPRKLNSLDGRTQEMLQALENCSRRGADLVKQILSFTRGTEGNRIRLQAGHLLLEVANIIEQTFPKSIEIRRNIPIETLWPVFADPTHLHQVVMNLAVNARDAMPQGGILTLTAENRHLDESQARMRLEAHVGEYVVLGVSDTGVGVAPDLLDRIFDPFFTTKEIGQGTGLGLSTVLGIVKNHGGFVEVSSQLAQGTQFHVYLPAISTLGVADAPALPAHPIPQGQGKMVLIVDDEAMVQRTTQALLEAQGYQTMVANSGIDAISLYAQHNAEIDVALIDMMMPQMDGLTTLRKLKSINPDILAIVVSGLPENKKSAIAAGAKMFLPKPYSFEDILYVLHRVLSDRPPQDESPNGLVDCQGNVSSHS